MQRTIAAKAGDFMLWLFMTLLAGYALFLEMNLQADLHHFDRTQGRFILRIAGIRKIWQVMLVRTAQGHRLVLADEDSTRPLDAGQLRRSRGSMLLDALRRADKARKFLLKHTHLDRLDALLLLHAEDAARSALLSGTVRSVLYCIPAVRRKAVRIRVLPEFFRAHSTVNARCIIRIRLGTIILTAMMLLIAYIREQRQQKARHAYGTSHW